MNKTLLVSRKNVVLRDATEEEVKLGLPVEEDGEEYALVRARDQLKRAIYEQRGECQLRRPNGTFVGRVTNPDEQRDGSSKRKCPAPQHCQCKKWAGAIEGFHHEACTFNALAPEDEQHPAWKAKKRQQERVFTDSKTDKTVKELAGPKLIAPEDCQCVDWADREEGRHHGLCSFREAWEEANPFETAIEETIIETDSEEQDPNELVLFSVQQSRIARDASEEEIAMAAEKDVPLITLDGSMYLVIKRKEALAESQPEESQEKESA